MSFITSIGNTVYSTIFTPSNRMLGSGVVLSLLGALYGDWSTKRDIQYLRNAPVVRGMIDDIPTGQQYQKTSPYSHERQTIDNHVKIILDLPPAGIDFSGAKIFGPSINRDDVRSSVSENTIRCLESNNVDTTLHPTTENISEEISNLTSHLELYNNNEHLISKLRRNKRISQSCEGDLNNDKYSDIAGDKALLLDRVNAVLEGEFAQRVEQHEDWDNQPLTLQKVRQAFTSHPQRMRNSLLALALFCLLRLSARAVWS